MFSCLLVSPSLSFSALSYLRRVSVFPVAVSNSGVELAIQLLASSSPGNTLSSVDEFLLDVQRPRAIPGDEV